jgi:aspartate racemase
VQKTIGLLGGITWESTLEYYRAINRETARRLGGIHSAKIVLNSFDFHEVRGHTLAGNEAAVVAMFVDAARRLERAGAELLLLCANTAHRRADEVQRGIGIPILHIGDAVGEALKRAGIAKAGLVGTRPTMEEAFMRGHLERGFGLQVVVPGPERRVEIDGLIFGEMAKGVFSDGARSAVRGAIAELLAQGAAGVILGCTEIPILMRGEAAACPLFDTTELHAVAAVERSLS